VAFLVASGAGPAGAGELDADLVVIGRGLVADGPAPWIDGGFGKLGEGGNSSGGWRRAARGKIQLGVDWSPALTWRVHVHALARTEPGAAGGWRAGVPEAYLEYRPVFSARAALRLRAGAFFPHTSLENVDPLWQSPYTVTFSALNSWVGEEVRPVGLDAALQLGEPGRDEWTLAGCAFGGADTAGTLLSWRGFALGDRLSVAGEVLPLPPLPSLRPGGWFADQRDDGTVPIDELDGRVGWQARGRYAREDAVVFQASWLDNRGDRGLHRGQYAWETRFATAGAEVALPGGLRLVAEVAGGDTGMGPRDKTHVQVRFRVGYALLTWSSPGGAFRLTARYDRFDNEDQDGTADPDGEKGDAWTAAAFWRPDERIRVGVEYADVQARRPAAAIGPGPDVDGRRALVELRLQL